MKQQTTTARWRHFFSEEFLSLFLSIGLLLGVLFMLTFQSAREYQNARQKALETTGFAISTYAENLSTILLKADSTALIVSRGMVDGVLTGHIKQQLISMIQDDRNLTGFIYITAQGQIADSFSFQNLNRQSLRTSEILARHRDAWIEPAFQPSSEYGLTYNHIAAERGVWTADGTFAGVIVILVASTSPNESTELEKFLTGSKVRVSSFDNTTILTDQYDLQTQKMNWLTAVQESMFWDRLNATEALNVNTERLDGDLVLARRNIPGLPLSVFMQVPSSYFFEHYMAMVRNALIASCIIVAVTVFLFLRIHTDRRHKKAEERKRRELDKRLQFALDTAGQALWEWNIPEKRGYFSENFYQLLDIPRNTRNLDYDRFRARIHPEDLPAFDRATKAHTPTFELEARMRIGTGDQWEWFAHSGSVTERDTNDNPAHVIGLIKNIHQQKLRNMKLEFVACHDPLTGLLNRASFDDWAARLHARYKRTGAPYAMIMLDVDHFKHVNDTYGHDVGDKVLQHIATTTYGTLRYEEEKMFFRLGGEEFVILLSYTDEREAVGLAERIIRTVEDSPVIVNGQEIKVTISAGVAGSHDDQKPNDILKRADEALYQAKENGRNQVCLASAHSEKVPADRA